jgi:hypothetical protein
MISTTSVLKEAKHNLDMQVKAAKRNKLTEMELRKAGGE